MQRPDIACLRDFGKVGCMNQDSLYEKATGKDLGGPVSGVGWVLRESSE